MAKFPEAITRLIKNIFVCRRCKSKVRAQQMKVLNKKVQCRKCGSRALRVVRTK